MTKSLELTDDLELQWQYPIREPLQDNGASGLVVARERCYAIYSEDKSDGWTVAPTVKAIDAHGGSMEWEATLDEWPAEFSALNGPIPVVGAGMVFVGERYEEQRQLTALTATTGERESWIPGMAPRMVVPAAGLLHMGRRKPSGDRDEYEILAVDPLAGELHVRREIEGDPKIPVVHDGDILYPVGSGYYDEATPRIERLDPETGERLESIEIGCQSAPVVADGRLFTTRWGDDWLGGVDLNTGSIAWDRDLPFDDVNEDQDVTPRYRFGGVTGDRLVVLKELHGYGPDEIIALDPATGDHYWELTDWNDSDVRLHAPIVTDDTLILTGKEIHQDEEVGFLSLFDLADGTQIQRKELPGVSTTSPVVAYGRIYVACRDGVYAFE